MQKISKQIIKHVRRIYPSLILFIVIISCFSKVKITDAEYPLNDVRISSIGEIEIQASAGVDLEEIVVLDSFKASGLRPGITIQEAEKILGMPNRTVIERDGRDTIYGFETDIGELQIIKQRVASEGSETDRWFLRLHILEGFIPVHASILKHIPSGDRDWRVRIYSTHGSDKVAAVDVQSGKITYLWWLV